MEKISTQQMNFHVDRSKEMSSPSLLKQLSEEFSNLVESKFNTTEITRDMWINLEDNDAANLLIHLRRRILQAYYVQLLLLGELNDHVGKWMVLVGNNIWDKKSYDTEDAAIDSGCESAEKGYPPVVYSVQVGEPLEILKPLNAPYVR